MNKNYIIHRIACIVCLIYMIACTKEQEKGALVEEISTPVTENLSAIREGETTKITMTSGRQFGWSPDDIIAVSVFKDEKWSFMNSSAYSDGHFSITYDGERKGVAVLPALFAKNYDGSNLTVTYPTSYSIADEVDAGIYDNANGSSYIWFPMVAESTSESYLVFRSIGALVKVVVREVPRGTKKLYVRFNKRVTGDFLVRDLGTSSPYVEAEEGSSVIEYTISSDGLGKSTDITLYIPVPTTTGLSISSTTRTMTTVARNKGYEFDVKAISRVSTETDFCLDGTNYVLAPGNLYAYNNAGEIEYHNRTAADQIITTLGAMSQDPHKDGATLLDINKEGNYRDMFTWNQLYPLFNHASPTGAAGEVIDGKLTFDGFDWKMLPLAIIKDIVDGAGNRDYRKTIEVAGFSGAVCAAAEIDLLNTEYFYYYQFKSSMSGNLAVFGRFLFPDGYVDMTDLLKDSVTDNMESGKGAKQVVSIESSAYEQMVAAGAIFLVNGGIADKNAVCSSVGRSHLAYVFGTTSVANRCDGLAASAGYNAQFQTTCGRDSHRSVRLYRVESKKDTETTPSVPGYDNNPLTDW